MSRNVKQPAWYPSSKPVTMRVEYDRRGAWTVAQPGERRMVKSETFDDARR